jgi:uncharacterized protein with gpF-like domain
MFEAIQAQIEAFIAQGLGGELPKAPVNKVLRKLYEAAGYANAMYVRRSIKRNLRKGEEDISSKVQWMINEYYRTNLLSQAVTPITETTKRQINLVMEESAKEGWGYKKTVSKLRATDITKQRAELIVRTETMKAANAGAMLSAASFGIPMNKVWISSQDNRTRRIPRNQYDHLHMNGIKIGFTDAFIVPSTKTIDAMQYPGDPVGSAGNVCNCRCTVAFEPAQSKPVSPLSEPISSPISSGIGSNVFIDIANQAFRMSIVQSLVNELIAKIEQEDQQE